MSKIKVQRLSIWRMKDRLGFHDAISESARGFQKIDFNIGDVKAQLLTKQSPKKTPDWVNFLKSSIVKFNFPLESQSAAALLLIETSGRIFALSFGAARFWIDKEAFDRRFGMMATLNAVDENSLRSLDREEFESQQRKTRTQTSSHSNLGQFGIDVQRDLLRSVTGVPIDAKLAENMTGSDALNIATRVEFDQIPAKLDRLNELADSDEYQEKGFDWIDHFHRVTDPTVIAVVNDRLVAAIKDDDLSNIFLAAPTSIDFDEHIGFLYPKERVKSADKHSDLRMAEYVQKVGRENIDLAKLKSDQIRHFRNTADQAAEKFSVYRSIIFESRDSDYLYVLTDGEVYQVDDDHVKDVESELMQIALCNLSLPDATEGEHERDYNFRVCDADPDKYHLLDRKVVSYGGKYSKIEVCDILTAQKQLIHVKPKIKSNTLSHLFNQGLVSAQCLADSRFREKAAEKCSGKFKKYFIEKSNNEDYEIVYAIISTTPGDIRNALPFFSKQSLVNACSTIRGLGHPVCLMQIQVS